MKKVLVVAAAAILFVSGLGCAYYSIDNYFYNKRISHRSAEEYANYVKNHLDLYEVFDEIEENNKIERDLTAANIKKRYEKKYFTMIDDIINQKTNFRQDADWVKIVNASKEERVIFFTLVEYYLEYVTEFRAVLNMGYKRNEMSKWLEYRELIGEDLMIECSKSCVNVIKAWKDNENNSIGLVGWDNNIVSHLQRDFPGGSVRVCIGNQDLKRIGGEYGMLPWLCGDIYQVIMVFESVKYRVGKITDDFGYEINEGEFIAAMFSEKDGVNIPSSEQLDKIEWKNVKRIYDSYKKFVR